MSGLVAELVMRAGFEFNAGRYWDELRRVNFDHRDQVIESRSLPVEEVHPAGEVKPLEETLKR